MPQYLMAAKDHTLWYVGKVSSSSLHKQHHMLTTKLLKWCQVW